MNSNTKVFAIVQVLVMMSVYCHSKSQTIVIEELIYKNVGSFQLAMTIVSPSSTSEGGLPLFMILPDESSPDRAHYLGLARILADSGFLVSIVDYRSPPDYKFPAAYEDVLDAMEMLKSSKKYSISSVGLIGQNFGGYLASIVGLRNPSKVQVITVIHSPMNLETYKPSWGYPYRIHAFIGKSYVEDPLLWQQLSPYHLADKSSPAFLILHGKNDDRIPLDQSREFYSKLKELLVDTNLLEDSCGNGDFLKNSNIEPTASRITDFANRHFYKIPKGVELHKDVVYSEFDSNKLKLDIYLPSKKEDSSPAVVFFHGGGWIWGRKEHMSHYAAELASHGFVTFTVEYRLARKDQYPACIDDAKAAIRWIRSRAKNYNINPNKIGVAGQSAGGHIAAILGVTNDQKFLGTLHGPANYEANVQAVATLSGVVDMSALYPRDKLSPAALFGVSPLENPEIYKSASPINLVTEDSSPMVFIHGTNDQLGLLSEMKLMTGKLINSGVKAETFEIIGGGHDFERHKNFRDLGFQKLLSFMEDCLK